jgi:hypothetical protein
VTMYRFPAADEHVARPPPESAESGPRASGDPMPSGTQVIEVHVAELKQLFNSIDPSPFGEKDLDPKAEEFIVGWARELPRTAPLALMVYLDRPSGLPDDSGALRDAISQFFQTRAEASRRRLRQLFRVGRTSLFIGFVFLALSIAIGEVIERVTPGHFGEIAREGLLIGGWVAMWRPLEIFLYDWWPIRVDIKLATRLSAMPVQIRHSGSDTNTWPRDRPAVPPKPT